LFPLLSILGMTRRHPIQGRGQGHGGCRVTYVGGRGVGISLGSQGHGGFRPFERVPASLGCGPDIECGRARGRRSVVEADGLGSADGADRPSRGGSKTRELSGRAGAAPRRRTALRRKKSPSLLKQLRHLVEPETGGDPGGKRQFSRISLRRLAQQLKTICHVTVGRLLRKLKFSLKTNVKRLTGPPHPDRDRQFRWIGKVRRRFLRAGAPVVSIDTKNSVLVGNFKNPGTHWCQQAEVVNAHDFPGDAECRAIPYGVYELGRNRGHVCVGTCKDTAEFAVNSVRDWWRRKGRRAYLRNRLLVLADSGGSNGCRLRLWKRELQRLADGTGLTITVAHYPRGASKWNPVEHRLFGPISQNWKGRPLRSLETVLGYIRGTTTQTGLTVTARLDPREYRQKIKVSDAEMRQLNIRRHRVCPQWNYTISPRAITRNN
jgi:Rhodopirellula transposase DDE domain